MKLYYVPGACSMASHIVLNELGESFETEKVDMANHKLEGGADYYDISPNGYVPALQLDDGDILVEGPAILQYLTETSGNRALALPDDPKQRARVRQYLTFVGTELHKTFSPLFSPDTSDDVRASAVEKIGKRLDYIEDELSDGRPYIAGDAFSIADAYLFTVANWTHPTGIGLGDRENLKAYMGRIAERDAVQKTMQAEGLVS